MTIVKHRFLNHAINPHTETLIIGSFNPEAEDNKANFFYGRSRNFLWRLLPRALNAETLKGATKEKKLSFIESSKVDFVDLIKSVKVEEGEEANYLDTYIDFRVEEWTDVLAEMKALKNLKRVCFTRKTFERIPNMEKKIQEIQSYCESLKIKFSCLSTPARFYNEEKQAEWTKFMDSDSVA
jgi:G:T/U-mismatch repair DNA glycosylase